MLLLLSGGDETVTTAPITGDRLPRRPRRLIPDIDPEGDDALVLVAILRHRLRL